MDEATPNPGKRPRANAILTQRRVSELVRWRLDGAERWDVLENVRAREKKGEAPWEVPADANPLSEGTIWSLLTKADREIHDSHSRNRKQLFRRHLAQRRSLYAKAVLAGDLRTALACVKDEAELLNLYPAKVVKGEITGKNGEALNLNREPADAAALASAFDMLNRRLSPPEPPRDDGAA